MCVSSGRFLNCSEPQRFLGRGRRRVANTHQGDHICEQPLLSLYTSITRMRLGLNSNEESPLEAGDHLGLGLNLLLGLCFFLYVYPNFK